MMRVQVYRDRKGDWRWRVFARNGRIVAVSGEGYKRLGPCSAMVTRLFPWARRGATP